MRRVSSNTLLSWLFWNLSNPKSYLKIQEKLSSHQYLMYIVHIFYIFSFMLPVISFENFQKVEMIILNFKIFVALHTFKKKFRCNIRIIPHCLEVRFFFYLNHASSSDFFLSHNTILHLDINFMLTEADHILV